MSGPLAALVDGLLLHDPQFNAKSQFNSFTVPPTSVVSRGRFRTTVSHVERRCVGTLLVYSLHAPHTRRTHRSLRASLPGGRRADTRRAGPIVSRRWAHLVSLDVD